MGMTIHISQIPEEKSLYCLMLRCLFYKVKTYSENRIKWITQLIEGYIAVIRGEVALAFGEAGPKSGIGPANNGLAVVCADYCPWG